MEKTDYRVVYSKRKSIAISIDSDGMPLVRAPKFVTTSEIETVLERHRLWITRQQNRQAFSKEKYPQFVLQDGAVLPFFGREVTIQACHASKFFSDDKSLYLPLSTDHQAVTDWLKGELHLVLEQKVAEFSKQMRLEPPQFSVTKAKTRWGSCSPANRLNFTLYLAFCPPDVIDYVVVHELAHIRHKNHGTAFWNEVASVLPEFSKYRTWLKENAGLMDFYDVKKAL